MDKAELFNRYVELKEQEKAIKTEINKVKSLLLALIEEQQGLPVVVGDSQIAVRTRTFYEYDAEALAQTAWARQYGILKTAVDTAKLQKLVKANLVDKKTLEHFKKVSKEVRTLVIEKVKK